MHSFGRALAAGLVLAAAGIGSADAQKISEFPNMPGNSAALGDAVVTQSNSCTGGNCRTTVGQMLSALGTGNTVSLPTSSDYVLLIPSGQTPRMAPISGLAPAINSSALSIPLSLTGTDNSPFTGDGAGLSIHINEANTDAGLIFQDVIGCPRNTCYNYDGIRSILTNHANSTTTNTNAYGAYVLNLAKNGGTGQNAVGYFVAGISGADNAQTWGINTNLTDSVFQGSVQNSLAGRRLANEFDYNVNSNQTVVWGLVFQGASSVKPQAATAILVSPLNLARGDIPWDQAVYSGDNAAVVALHAGTSGMANVSNQKSQTIELATTDGSDTERVTQIFASPSGLNGLGATPAVFAMTASSIQTAPVTVSSLPSCGSGTSGSFASVTDAQSANYNQSVSGGGSTHIPVFCNGSNWVAH